MSIRIKWNDREFERKVLNREAARFMHRLGARGEAISKKLISGNLDAPRPTFTGTGIGEAFATMRAVDTGRLMNSLTFEVDERRLIVRIGTNVKYAVYVFLGTIHMGARPILRTMLAMLRIELR